MVNRLRSAPEDLPAGPHLFAEDRIDGDVFLARIDDELEYLAAVRDGARDVTAAVHAAAGRASARLEAERQGRRDRFSLLQTAVIGVLVMILTAVQSLHYQGPFDRRVHPALIALLGALALVLGVEMLGRAESGGAGSGPAARVVSIGLCGAAAGWMVETLVRVQILGQPSDAVSSWVAAAVGFVLVAAAVLAVRRLRARRGKRTRPCPWCRF